MIVSILIALTLVVAKNQDIWWCALNVSLVTHQTLGGVTITPPVYGRPLRLLFPERPFCLMIWVPCLKRIFLRFVMVWVLPAIVHTCNNFNACVAPHRVIYHQPPKPPARRRRPSQSHPGSVWHAAFAPAGQHAPQFRHFSDRFNLSCTIARWYVPQIKLAGFVGWSASNKRLSIFKISVFNDFKVVHKLEY